MNKIYLNPDLCEDMIVSYEGKAKLRVFADTLLRSSSFDEVHSNFLKNWAKSGKSLTLTRNESDLPGWFWVETI